VVMSSMIERLILKLLRLGSQLRRSFTTTLLKKELSKSITLSITANSSAY
jgi:hypothetical protein